MAPIFAVNQNKKHAAGSLWTYWNEKETHNDKQNVIDTPYF